ncbi:AGE family epimerase/isomerase [Rhizobium sp. KVB221]|uniref:AGE family epimerase/isomerase n=1 Tax=Rhizobium setariae TaxID=2801340 RepID=A0A936YWA7_9HYPH|nr:AGE family epimerase/isomerase [Rhizobium setariae]MBL0374907.1 AGE family epimerase/isomerase [Rhizobium setariae]
MTAQSWLTLPTHRDWLMGEANRLFEYFQWRSINPKGGFYEFDADGKPLNADNPVRGIHMSARMVHCMTIGHLLGRPGCADLIDHGMDFLWNAHRDRKHGGYFWQVDNDGPCDATKQGYGHAFVLLAASSASLVGHPVAEEMLADVTEILDTKFWEDNHGAIAEEFQADWTAIPGYRGQNSNMHLTEALMAAYEATDEDHYLQKAERIADLIINRLARQTGFRVGEHFDENWNLLKNYKGNEMFRPSGTTPGHWLEWSRLLLQLYALGDHQHDWMLEAAQALFAQSMALGWDHAHGGFFYTLDWNDQPAKRAKLWWPMAEGIGAASFLVSNAPSDMHESSYRLIWNTIASRFLDRDKGGWHEELSEQMVPSHEVFAGKADIYHALQACLIPLYPADGSLTSGILQAQAD